MADVREFKRIAKEPEEKVELFVPKSVALKLSDLAERLERELGFEVTLESAIGWLVKQEQVVNRLAPGVAAIEDAIRAKNMNEEAESLMRQGRKIDAIKLVRSQTAMGLKEAKDYCESKWNHLVPPRS